MEENGVANVSVQDGGQPNSRPVRWIWSEMTDISQLETGVRPKIKMAYRRCLVARRKDGWIKLGETSH